MSINDLSPEIQERIWSYLSKEAATAFLLELQRLSKRAAVTLPVKDELGKEIVSTVGAIEDFLKARPETQQQSASKSDRRRGSLAALALEKRGLRSRIAGCKVIDIAPASAQFHASFPDAKSFDGSKVAPNVAPPFDRMHLLDSGSRQGFNLGRPHRE